jgi:nitrile hydratase subunit beta
MSYHSHADMGGHLGHGRVVPEPEGEHFHADWEARAMALTVAMGATGAWNLDASRAARETLPDYAQLSYYEIWIAALRQLLRDRGLVADDELAQTRALHAALPVPRRLAAAEVAAAIARGSPTLRATGTPPRYAVGDHVRMVAAPVPHHTRLPGYVRGKCGTVQALHGAHVFPDTNAQGLGEQPCRLYTVAFDGRELWGEDAMALHLMVSVDAWEPYMEPA